MSTLAAPPPTIDLEPATQRIGRHLFALARKNELTTSDGPLDRALMTWTMRDEQLKAQLFRLVDVLPTLPSARQITTHLLEYLAPVRDRLPTPAARALGHLPTDGYLASLIAAAARHGVRRMARRFIAATDLPHALRAIKDLRRQLQTFTIDLLGEAVLSENEAAQYQQTYIDLLAILTADEPTWPVVEQIDTLPPLPPGEGRGEGDLFSPPLPRVNVSIKLSSLYSQFDPIDPAGTSSAVRHRLRPILRLARKCGAFVNIDMEQSAYKDLTLQIFREILEEPEFRTWPHAGIAIQAYLKSCLDDLASLASWVESRGTPVTVRLVKGAYWDYESVISAQNDWPLPVFPHKPETDANYEAATTFLLTHHDLLRPAIASHNVRSLAHALALAEHLDLPPRSFEFQMLYGMADPIKSALVSLGHRVRVYMPMGQLLPGMAYLVRRLLENTSNESFLRAGFLEHRSEDELLMNPLQLIKRNHTPRPTLVTASTPFKNEPLTDFSRADARASMQKALRAVSAQFGAPHPLVINARRIESGKWIDSINPANPAQIVGRCAAATPRQAADAIQAAKSAFPAWRDTPPQQRAAILRRAARLMRRRRFELAAWEVYETAKQWREADADVAEAIDYCEFYAREMIRLATRPHRRDIPGESNETFYEPRGVAVTIAPWNFPLAILCGMTAAALVTGNTVVMKPAEQSPVIAAKLMEVFEEAGFPPGVVNYLPGVGEEIGPTLSTHPDVATIAFTGSRTVGLSLQRQGAETPEGQHHVKRVITEMGGKNAIIIDEDADLDEAVHGVLASAFGYAGQKCSACSRAIVLQSIYDPFLTRLVEATRSLKVGPPEDPTNFIGPVIDAEAHKRIKDYIETGKREATLAYPDASSTDYRLLATGYHIPPTIFSNVPPSSTIAQQEIFGPVLSVTRASDLPEALSIANSTQYALTGGLYSRSPATIERVKREFRVGNLYINRKCTGALVDRQPFGGFKLSGTGPKAGGPDYLPAFCHARTITENTLRRGFAPMPTESTPGE